MRIVIIGATGHIGGYLVPRLVAAGHEVIALSRGGSPRYRDHPAWAQVTTVIADREQEDAAGRFGERIATLDPDVVVDLVCFTPESAAQLVDAVRSRAQLLVMCSTIWVHGAATAVPTDEDEDLEPWGQYGTAKLAIERLLAEESARPGGLRSIVLRPGHISGPGWPIINPAGNLDPGVWERLARGERLVLPGRGLETLHHVHADDVAQAFQLAVERGTDVGAADAPGGGVDARGAGGGVDGSAGGGADGSAGGGAVLAGRAYHVTSERALTLRGFAREAARWFGREAMLEFAPWEEFAASTSPEHAATTLEHVSRSPAASIERARRELGYAPRYTSLEAAREALDWLIANGRVEAGG